LEQRLTAAALAAPQVGVRPVVAAAAVSSPSPAETTEGEEAVTARVGSEGAPVEDAPQWPDESAEAAFLSEQRVSGVADGGARVAQPSKPAADEDSEVETAPLPALQSLVDRIPADAREVLEELFRAKFYTVKKVPKAALKE
jgi:hypothetical protein